MKLQEENGGYRKGIQNSPSQKTGIGQFCSTLSISIVSRLSTSIRDKWLRTLGLWHQESYEKKPLDM